MCSRYQSSCLGWPPKQGRGRYLPMECSANTYAAMSADALFTSSKSAAPARHGFGHVRDWIISDVWLGAGGCPLTGHDRKSPDRWSSIAYDRVRKSHLSAE